MGDDENTPLKLNFDSKVRLEFRGATITSDAGLLACRELDDALGLTDSAEEYLNESRTGKNILHKLIPLLRQSIYSRLAGYDDTNDADRLSQDPAMRVLAGWQGSERNAASTSEMSRFETDLLTQEDNVKGLSLLNNRWVNHAMDHTVHRRIILDIDSSESQVHGNQEDAAYNGHFECVCYHPLFCFNQFGDCEGAVLRPGNVHSADGWEEFIEPIVECYLKMAVRFLFRADAAFAKPELYEYMEARHIGYAIRLPTNDVLQPEIAHLLVRPTEWPYQKPIVSHHDFAYQAQSWLECSSESGSQSRVAPGRAVPENRFHRHKPQLPGERYYAILQRQGYSRAVDQGGQVCLELDSTLVSQIRSQPGEAGAVHPGIQYGQLLQKAGAARRDKALVADKCPDKTHQDRRTTGAPCQEVGVPACRSDGE